MSERMFLITRFGSPSETIQTYKPSHDIYYTLHGICQYSHRVSNKISNEFTYKYKSRNKDYAFLDLEFYLFFIHISNILIGPQSYKY